MKSPALRETIRRHVRAVYVRSPSLNVYLRVRKSYVLDALRGRDLSDKGESYVDQRQPSSGTLCCRNGDIDFRIVGNSIYIP